MKRYHTSLYFCISTLILLLVLSPFFSKKGASITNSMNASGRDIALIEGTRFEGGGGLIRDTLSYAALLNKRVRIESIRANRPGKGGLRGEHTVSINALSTLTSSKVEGNIPHSREIIFDPHAGLDSFAIQPLYSLDTEIEGAAPIFMVAMLPYILFSGLGPSSSYFSKERIGNGIELTIRAGTLCVRAPSFAYVHQVLIPTFRSINIGEDNLKAREDHDQGWHTEFFSIPGRMAVWAKPFEKPIQSFHLDRRGMVVRIRATIHGPADVLDAFHRTVKEEIENSLIAGWSESVEVLTEAFKTTVPDQYHLLLVAETEGPQAFLGYEQIYPQRGGFPEGPKENSKEIFKIITLVCIRGLYDELAHGNAVDEHLEDMLVPYQALADGFSSVSSEENKKLVQEKPELAVPFGMQNSSFQDKKSLTLLDTSESR